MLNITNHETQYRHTKQHMLRGQANTAHTKFEEIFQSYFPKQFVYVQCLTISSSQYVSVICALFFYLLVCSIHGEWGKEKDDGPYIILSTNHFITHDILCDIRTIT